MEFDRLCPGCMRELENRGQLKNCPHCGYDLQNMQAAPHQLQPFTILNGKYVVGKVIGEGGFGITYLGADINLGMPVAVKEFYPNGFVTRESTVTSRMTIHAGNNQQDIEKWRDGFIKEARSLARFAGLSGIVQVLDFFNENETAYIVMEYVDGITLKTYLKQNGGKIAAPEVLRMMDPVIKSLAKVHETGIIHRDISPDNIMMTKEGNMKLLDFGAARDVSGNAEKSLSVMLKPGYAPEEQYRSRGHQGPWSDVYALCGTIYKCITGKTPPEAMERIRNDSLVPPTALGAQLTGQQEQALLAGLSVYAENRIQNMGDLHNMLFGNAPVPAPAPMTGTGSMPMNGPMGGAAPMGANGPMTMAGGMGANGPMTMAGGMGANGPMTMAGGMGANGPMPMNGGMGANGSMPPKSGSKLPLIIGLCAGGAIFIVVVILIIAAIGGGSKKTPATKSDSMIASTNEEVNTPAVEEDTPQLEVQEYTNQNIARGDEAIANQDYITAFNAYLSVSESDADYQVAYDRIHEHLGTYVNHVKELKNEAQNEPNYDHYVDVIYQMDDANNILNQMLDFYPDFYEEYSDEMIYVTAETENSMANWSIDRAAEYTTARDFDSAQDLLWKVKQYIVSRPSSQYHDEFIPFYLPRYSKAYAMNEIQRAANMGSQGYGASDIAYTLRDAISESDYYGYLIELYEHYAHDAGMLYPYNAYKNGNNFILPESDSREYSYGEISNFNLTELRMARFEIYARHNRKFADPTVQKYFDGKVWYSGQIEAASFDESSLSEIEKANIRTIFACEMDLGYFR